MKKKKKKLIAEIELALMEEGVKNNKTEKRAK